MNARDGLSLIPRGAAREWPFVSVVVPCRNERAHIEEMLQSVIQSGYPRERFEVIVADGMSTDGTRAILDAAAARDGRIRVLDNHAGRKPEGLNAAIEAARGSVVVRMDAHSTYPPNYIPDCVAALIEFQADNVGGVQASIPTSGDPLAQAICLFYSGRLGLRRGRASAADRVPRPAETVYCGCFRRDVFSRFGWFDTRLTRGQDREFNARIRAHGGTILFLPWVEALYRPRTTMMAHARYMFLSGAVPFVAQSKVDTRLLSLRNKIAAATLPMTAAAAAFAVTTPILQVLGVVAGSAYLTASLAGGVMAGARGRSVAVGLWYPPVVWVSQSLYVCGAFIGAAGLSAAHVGRLVGKSNLDTRKSQQRT